MRTLSYKAIGHWITRRSRGSNVKLQERLNNNGKLRFTEGKRLFNRMAGLKSIMDSFTVLRKKELKEGYSLTLHPWRRYYI